MQKMQKTLAIQDTQITILIQKIFPTFKDKDSNTLSIKRVHEFINLIIQNFEIPNRDNKISLKQAYQIAGQYDKDQDGRISKQQLFFVVKAGLLILSRSTQEYKPLTPEQLQVYVQRVFPLFDQNNSKYMNAHEIQEYVNIYFKAHKSACRISIEQAKKLVKRHDRDGDGMISINQMATLVEQVRANHFKC